LAEWPPDACQGIRGVLTDIDDTLTREGRIEPQALQALHQLHAAGIPVVAITGRPAGWSETFAWGDPDRGLAPWPVHAIVAENGAVALIPENILIKINTQRSSDKHESLSKKIYLQPDAERLVNAMILKKAAQHIVSAIPQARLAHDSAGRETDIAIDHSEFNHLPPRAIAQVVDIMRSHGLTATVSSIHINGWLGQHNKRVGAHWILQTLWGRALDQELDQWVYVGDSPNDQIMFQHLPHTVGVANIGRFWSELQHHPRYVTRGERGTGFAEVAQRLLALRHTANPATAA
jgi:HAD superfamily hydrolase (TIGR01484 family)